MLMRARLLVFLVVLTSLVMVYGLTCDGGKSFTSRALQLPVAKWLGSVSYSLYLSHCVVRCYVVFVLDTRGYSVNTHHGAEYSPENSPCLSSR
jgi:peptidoglycan/LPS O-acetylase OafA/YrhL